MDEFDSHRAFPNARSEALGRAMPDVARDEYSRNARFQIKRIAIGRPTLGAAALAVGEMLSRNDVTQLVPFHDASQPFRSGQRPGIDEQSAGRSRGLFAGISLEGSTLRPDNNANEKLYGRKVSAKEIIRDGAVPVPPSGQKMISVLNTKSPKNTSDPESLK